MSRWALVAACLLLAPPVSSAEPEDMTLGGHAVTVREEFERGGRYGADVRTLWLDYRDGTRRVGLRLEGGSLFLRAQFLVGGVEPEPSEPERALLLRRAGYVAFDRKDPRDGLAAASSLETEGWLEASEEEVPSGPSPAVTLHAHGVQSWAPSQVALVPQRKSWRPMPADAPDRTGMLVPDGMRSVCPCWLIADNTLFVPSSGPAPWRISAIEGQDAAYALGLPDASGKRMRWLGHGGGVIRLVGHARGRWWFASTSRGNDSFVDLIVANDRRDTWQRIRVEATVPHALRLTRVGLVLGVTTPDDAAQDTNVELTIPFAELEAAMRTPGKTRPIAGPLRPATSR